MPTIVIADDDNMNLLIISRILQSIPVVKEKKVEIIQVTNGGEAVKHCESIDDEVKLVLMDCEMPIMDGYTAS